MSANVALNQPKYILHIFSSPQTLSDLIFLTCLWAHWDGRPLCRPDGCCYPIGASPTSMHTFHHLNHIITHNAVICCSLSSMLYWYDDSSLERLKISLWLCCVHVMTKEFKTSCTVQYKLAYIYILHEYNGPIHAVEVFVKCFNEPQFHGHLFIIHYMTKGTVCVGLYPHNFMYFH